METISSLILSTPVWLAASISTKSTDLLAVIVWQLIHLLQGLPSWTWRQLIALDRILAVLVLPVPLGPKIYMFDLSVSGILDI